MKWALRNKTDEKGLKWRFSSCWFSLICTLPYIFLSFIRTILLSSILCENTRKSLNLQICNGTFQNIDFFRLFKYGGRVGKRLVKFYHPLQLANFSLRLVQNNLHYVNIMNFESILCVFLFNTGMFQRIEN